MKNPWIKHSTKLLLKNKWWQVVQDSVTHPDGQPGEWNIVETPGSVTVIALTENHEVILNEQFRYIIDRPSIEAPGGGMEPGHPLESAKRELQEETGITAQTWIELGEMQPCNGLLRETMYLYLAQDLDISAKKAEHTEGIANVLQIPFPEVLDMIQDGRIDDGPTMAAMLRAGLHVGLLSDH